MALPFLVDVYTETWEEEKKDKDGMEVIKKEGFVYKWTVKA